MNDYQNDPHYSDNIFRGYDIRGIYPTELNEAGAYRIGLAYATFLSRRRINEAVITGDNRNSTVALKKAFTEALLYSGINVIDHGLGLVYFMYFSQYYHQSKGGVNVSASHNPKEYNGFKLAVGFSDTMITEEIIELKEIAKKGEFVKSDIRGNYSEEEIFSKYKKDLFKRMPQKLNYKIVIDGGNCTPGMFMPEILRESGCEVIQQNTDLNGDFPLGTPDPTEREYLTRLAEGVINNKADLGFCYDPDGDRIGIVDNEGTAIWNDVLVSIFASDLLDFQPGAKIIFNALCSKQVTDVIKQKGGIPIMWLTGHSFIKSKLKEERALFGGELSGHFFFMDNFYGHDDCAFTSLRLLNYLKRKNITLKDAVESLPRYISSPEIKLGLGDDIKFSFIKNILRNEIVDLFNKPNLTEIDGIRAETDEEMVIVRASQNGPYLTVKFEGKNQEQYDNLKSKIRDILKSHKEIEWDSGVNIKAFE